MKRATAKQLVGRRIVAVDFRPFPTGRGRGRTTNPSITLDDGSILTFDVEETEDLDYGVEIMRAPPRT